MAGAAATRVLADGSVDLEALGAALRDTGARVEPVDGAPAGADVVGLVTWERPIGAAELARLPGLRVLLTPSVGFDHLDLDAARRHGGTWVCHVPGYCVDEMADTALALVLALLRGVVALDRHVRAGGWDADGAGPLRRIRGTRLGVVGHGRIVEQGPTERIFTAPSADYTRKLLANTPSIEVALGHVAAPSA